MMSQALEKRIEKWFYREDRKQVTRLQIARSLNITKSPALINALHNLVWDEILIETWERRTPLGVVRYELHPRGHHQLWLNMPEEEPGK